MATRERERGGGGYVLGEGKHVAITLDILFYVFCSLATFFRSMTFHMSIISMFTD